jgi:peptide/nickel transport system substrate-binding protein
VHFQDGGAFTADDVVYSFARARGPGSNLAHALAGLRDVTKIDDFTVDIRTFEPDAILPQEIVVWDIMSVKWCAENGVEEPADPQRVEDSFASYHADGTGPFMVETRRPDVQTVLVANPRWWDRPEHDLDRVVFRPMAGANAVAALLAGNLDMLYSVPSALTDRIRRSRAARLVQGPELRTILLAFNMRADEHNPFRDKRVRRAFYQAIDEDTIRTKVMRGFATPAALLVGPGINGFDAALNERLPYDPGAAKRLLAEAGYATGFSAGMDCPTDRYVNDEAICDAVVAMLAKIGVKLRLDAQPRGKYFQKLLLPDFRSSVFMIGWAPATYDALNALVNLAATRNREAHLGDANFGGYSNPELDALLARTAAETDEGRRLALLHEALALVRDEIAFVPLHQQQVVWAARSNVELVQEADGSFPLRYVRVN